MASLVLGMGLCTPAALADTPASSVTTTVVNPGQSYPEVATNSEAWFDVGGFCKVVDVGGLTWANPPASGVPVFIPGPAAQWENYRTLGPNGYHGDLVLTTCCRPASDVATLCAGYTNPSSISRDYGRYGETDQITGTCIDSSGNEFTDVVSLTCGGSTGNSSVDNGPDGQGLWAQTSNVPTQQQPTCPSQSITWEDSSEDSQFCTGTLPVTQEGYGVSAVQTPSAATGWYGGTSANWTCISDGSGGAGWKGSAKMSDGYRGGTCTYSCTPSTTLIAVGTCNSQGLQEYQDATCGQVSYQSCGTPPSSGLCTCTLAYDTGDETSDGNGCATQYKDCGQSAFTGVCTGTCTAIANPNAVTDIFVQDQTSATTCSVINQIAGYTNPVYQWTCTGQ